MWLCPWDLQGGSSWRPPGQVVRSGLELGKAEYVRFPQDLVEHLGNFLCPPALSLLGGCLQNWLLPILPVFRTPCNVTLWLSHREEGPISTLLESGPSSRQSDPQSVLWGHQC